MWKISLWDSKNIKLQDNIKAVFLWDIKIYPNVIDPFVNIYARWKLKKYWPWDKINRNFNNYNTSLWRLWRIQSVWSVYWDRATPWGERGTVKVSNWRLYYPWLKDDWNLMHHETIVEEYFDTLTESHTIQHIMGFQVSGLSNDTDLI